MRRTVTMVFAAAALLAGCQRKTDTMTVQTGDGTSVAVDSTGDGNVSEVRMTTADGNTATMTATGDGQVRLAIPGLNATIQTGGGWPASFGTVAPAYPGGQVTGSFAGSGPDGGGGTVTFTTSDAPAKVIDFYKASAAAAGLSATTGVQASGQQMYTAADEKTGRTLTVQAQAEDGKTSASVLYGAGKH